VYNTCGRPIPRPHCVRVTPAFLYFALGHFPTMTMRMYPLVVVVLVNDSRFETVTLSEVPQ
jgi:hypothetical protein